MSTYAYWRLWVGAEHKEIDYAASSDRTKFLLDQFYGGMPLHSGTLTLEEIYMHGRTIGLGVKIVELSWTDEIGSENVFDPTKVTEAQAALPVIQQLFDKLELKTTVRIFHHLDLGG